MCKRERYLREQVLHYKRGEVHEDRAHIELEVLSVGVGKHDEVLELNEVGLRLHGLEGEAA